MEKQKWDEKVAKAMKKKKQDAEYAAMSEDKGRHSWSAAHPAYMGTSLCFRYAMGIILLAIGFHCAYKSKNEHKIADTIFWCTGMIIFARGLY